MEKTTLRNLVKSDMKSHKNKWRILYSIIAISTFILSMILIVSVNSINNLVNAYPVQALIQNANYNQYHDIKSQDSVKNVGIYKTLGDSYSNGKTTTIFYADNIGLKFGGIYLVKGKYPTDIQDIAVSKNYLQSQNKQIGDTIKFEYFDSSVNQKIEKSFKITGIIKFNSIEGEDNSKILVSQDYFGNENCNKSQYMDLYMSLNDDYSLRGKEIIKKEIKDVVFKAGIDKNKLFINDAYIEGLLGDSTRLVLIGIISISLMMFISYIIYSVFNVSINNDLSYCSKLKSLGMTNNQFKKFLSIQANKLSKMIPVGIILGCIVSFFMLKARMSVKITIILCLIIIAVVFITIKLSLRKPIKIIKKISVIDAYKGSNTKSHVSRKDIKKVSVKRIAKINNSEDKKKRKTISTSILITGIIFVVIASMFSSINYDKRVQQKYEYKEQFIITPKKTNIYNDIQSMQKADYFSNEFLEKVKKIKGVDRIIKGKFLKAEITKIGSHNNLNGTHTFESMNSDLLKNCKKKMISGNIGAHLLRNQILVNDWRMKDNYHFDTKVGDTITIKYLKNGEQVEEELKVAGITNERNSGTLIYISDDLISEITDRNMTTSISILTDKNSKYQEVSYELNTFLENYPQLEMKSYIEELNSIKSSFKLIENIILAITAVLFVFAIVNMINIMFNDFFARKRSFTVLEAVGMTKKQLKKMLIIEYVYLDIFIILSVLIISYIISRGFCYVLDEYVGWAFMIFEFSYFSYFMFALMIIIFQIIVINCFTKNLYNDSVSERLKIKE